MAKEKLKNVLNGITLLNESVGKLKGSVVEKNFDGKKRIAWVVTFTLNGERVRKIHNTGVSKEEYETAKYSIDEEFEYPLYDVRFLDYMFITVERYAIPLWIEEAKGQVNKTNSNISERITKTQSTTVETRAKSKTVETTTASKAVAPKKKKGFEKVLLVRSYTGNCDGYDELKAYLVKLEILNDKQIFIVTTADGVIQDIHPTGVKSINCNIANADFRKMFELLMDGLLEEVALELSANVDFYDEILSRGSSK